MSDPNVVTKQDLIEILKRLADEFERQKDYLSMLDTEIGDGDHGFSMASGFNSVADKLEEFSQLSIGELLKKTGFELIKTIGGAAGAVFGTLFTGQAFYYEKNLGDKESLTLQDLSEMFKEALAQIKRRGGAQPGDKTMLDALEPAVLALGEAAARGATLGDAFMDADLKARMGASRTKDMVAKHGRAKNLGFRAVGFIDPGAWSTALIFGVLSKYFFEREGRSFNNSMPSNN
jgi:dihydroxyacetone kinase-like protein